MWALGCEKFLPGCCVAFRAFTSLQSGVGSAILQLFDLTPNQDEYQRQGFGMVILVTTSLSLSVSVGTTILSTPFFRENVVTPIMIRCKKKTIDTVVKEDVGENENDNNGNASETEKMIANPISSIPKTL